MNDFMYILVALYLSLIGMCVWLAFHKHRHERERPIMTGVINDVFKDVNYTYYDVIDETNKSHTIKKKGEPIYEAGNLVKLKFSPRVDFLEYEEEVRSIEQTDA